MPNHELLLALLPPEPEVTCMDGAVYMRVSEKAKMHIKSPRFPLS